MRGLASSLRVFESSCSQHSGMRFTSAGHPHRTECSLSVRAWRQRPSSRPNSFHPRCRPPVPLRWRAAHGCLLASVKQVCRRRLNGRNPVYPSGFVAPSTPMTARTKRYAGGLLWLQAQEGRFLCAVAGIEAQFQCHERANQSIKRTGLRPAAYVQR